MVEPLRRAIQALSDGNLARAIAEAEGVVAKAPSLGVGWLVLGRARHAAGALTDAVPALRRATALDPTSAPAWLALGNTLRALGGVAEPTECFATALGLAPTAPWVLVPVGGFLLEQGELDEAAGCFRAAGDEGAPGLIQVAERRGDLAAASAVIEAHADQLGRSSAFTIAATRALIRTGRAAVAREALDRLAPAAPMTQVAIEHARGDALEALGEETAAFEARSRAHQARGLVWDVAAHAARVDGLIQTWTRDRFVEPPPRSGDDVVLLVGMPRSGTTLLEQILAAHSSVRTRGELDTLPDVERAGLAPADAAERYLTALRRDGTSPRLIDKLPVNFLHLHTAARCFANARVIHIRRDPLDTCVSCYSKDFHATLAWSTDLYALGRFYADHLRLMAHWRAQLPLPILEVEYEALVAAPEQEARRVLDFLGLTFEPACLRFFERTEAVNTASYAQVRRPIHRDAVGRARRLEAQLGPLRAGLAGG